MVDIGWGSESDWDDAVDSENIEVEGGEFQLASAIPDSGMFQSPVYQYTAAAGLSASDGQTASNWTEQLAGAGDASVVGDATYREDQADFDAVEYDGVDDGHNFPSDGQLPTNGDAVSIAATIYIKSLKQYNCVFAYGNTGDAGSLYLLIDGNGQVRPDITGQPTNSGGDLPTGQWVTVGAVFNSTDIFGYENGDKVSSDSPENEFNQTDENRSIGYSGPKNSEFSDVYIYDLIVSSTTESDQAFSDYHTARLG